MHQRIIWTLFFTAFILDVLRIQSGKPTKNQNPKNINKEKEIPSIQTKEREKEKEKIITNVEEDDFEENDEIKVIDNFKKNKKNKNINLRIEFCQSWSHRGYFNQVKQHLESNFTNIFVEPSDYPLSPQRKMLSYIVSLIQIGGVILAFAGNKVKPYVGAVVPDTFMDWIEGNKLMFGMGCFLLGNILNNNIHNAGAFEIYCNEKLLWSAINNNKKVPNLDTIILMINRYGGKLMRR